MALPGSHDFARDAWFQGMGGVGRALGPVEVIGPSPGGGLDSVRDRLGRHIRAQLPGNAGGIATALANGDQAAVNEEDWQKIRDVAVRYLPSGTERANFLHGLDHVRGLMAMGETYDILYSQRQASSSAVVGVLNEILDLIRAEKRPPRNNRP
jgi:hypothetical protein